MIIALYTLMQPASFKSLTQPATTKLHLEHLSVYILVVCVTFEISFFVVALFAIKRYFRDGKLILAFIQPGLWFNGHCAEKKGYVCHKEAGTDDAVTVPPTSETPGFCPEGYCGFGNN